jgi:hypothetical protein
VATVRATLSGTPEETSTALRRAAADLGYTLAERESELPTHAVFKKGVTAFSWGSDLRVTLTTGTPSDTAITVTTGEVVGITDWGRGKKAAMRLLDAAGAIAEA